MSPLVLAFNIRQSVYKAFSLSLYQQAAQHNFHLLPIITASTDGIEQRAKKISQQLPKLLNRLGSDRAHVACYSVCGVDFRFALSEFGMTQYCKTMTTISTPHKGSKLALLSDRNFFKPVIMDPISRLTGIGLKPFHEFTPQNMAAFNSCIFDVPSVEYYSVGSERMFNICPHSLQDTGKYLQLNTQPNYVYHNDGVFGHDEVQHGEYLVNFEADHGEVIGLYGRPKQLPALNVVKQIAEAYEKENGSKGEEQTN